MNLEHVEDVLNSIHNPKICMIRGVALLLG